MIQMGVTRERVIVWLLSQANFRKGHKLNLNDQRLSQGFFQTIFVHSCLAWQVKFSTGQRLFDLVETCYPTQFVEPRRRIDNLDLVREIVLCTL